MLAWSPNEADAFMPLFDQQFRHREGSGNIVEGHARMIGMRVAIAQGDNRDSHILHQFEKGQIAAQRRRQDQAVKADRTQALDDHRVVENAFDVRKVFNHQVMPEIAALFQCADQEGAEIAWARVVIGQPDQLGFAACKAACHQVRPVIERRNRRLNSQAGRFLDQLLLVQHP